MSVQDCVSPTTQPPCNSPPEYRYQEQQHWVSHGHQQGMRYSTGNLPTASTTSATNLYSPHICVGISTAPQPPLMPSSSQGRLACQQSCHQAVHYGARTLLSFSGRRRATLPAFYTSRKTFAHAHPKQGSTAGIPRSTVHPACRTQYVLVPQRCTPAHLQAHATR